LGQVEKLVGGRTESLDRCSGDAGVDSHSEAVSCERSTKLSGYIAANGRVVGVVMPATEIDDC
jgi:hypothetical protein